MARLTRTEIARLPAGEIQRLFHELHVRQIELEMENEGLRRAQAGLPEGRNRFSEFYDRAPVGYATLDREGGVTEANLTVAAMLGVERSKVVGRKFHRFILPVAQETFRRHRRALLEGSPRETAELLLRRGDGTTLAVRLESVRAGGAEAEGGDCWSAIIDVSASKLAERTLMRAQEELERVLQQRTADACASERTARAVIDSLTLHVAVVDEEGRILAVNERWREFAASNNAPPMAVCEGSNYLTVCDAAACGAHDEAAVIAAGIRAVLRGKSREFSAEYPCHAPAEERWFVMHVTPYSDHGRRRVVIAHEDITSRVKAERALRESEARFRQVTETIDQVFWMTDVSMDEIFYVSPGYERIWGRSCESLYASPQAWIEPIHPEDRIRVIEAVTRKFVNGRYDVEYRITRPDGVQRWIHDRGFPIRDAAGEIQRVAGVADDITERKNAEEACRQSEDRLRTTLNTVLEAIITVDRAGIVTSVNPATERMFGYSSAELLGRPAGRLLPPAFRKEHDRYLKNSQATGPAQVFGVGRDALGLRRDGSTFPIDVVISEVDSREMFIEVIRDLTKRKRLEAEVLRIAEEERLRVAADLHDGICQQLVGLQFLTVSLRRELESANHPLAAKARCIEQATVDTVAQTRQVARGMSPVVKDGEGLLQALQRLTVTTRQITGIDCRFEGAEPVSVADPMVANELYRIAQEATKNALHHSGAKRIVVRLSAADGEIQLRVTDNGQGLPSDVGGAPGMGLRVMRYRAGLIGGQFTIQPRRRGGTEVCCRVLQSTLRA